jgi:hypothetical protein
VKVKLGMHDKMNYNEKRRMKKLENMIKLLEIMVNVARKQGVKLPTKKELSRRIGLGERQIYKYLSEIEGDTPVQAGKPTTSREEIKEHIASRRQQLLEILYECQEIGESPTQKNLARRLDMCVKTLCRDLKSMPEIEVERRGLLRVGKTTEGRNIFKIRKGSQETCCLGEELAEKVRDGWYPVRLPNKYKVRNKK